MKKTSLLALALVLLPVSVFASTSVLVNNGAAYVSSSHPDIFTYKGYMRIYTNKKVGNYIYTGGWIRYYIPEGADSGKKYASQSGPNQKVASLTFKDSNNPIAAKTRFSYDLTKKNVGGSTTALPKIPKIIHESGEIVVD